MSLNAARQSQVIKGFTYLFYHFVLNTCVTVTNVQMMAVLCRQQLEGIFFFFFFQFEFST